MNIYEKLMEIQKNIDVVPKDGENKTDKYGYVSSSGILKIVRPKMDELGLLLFIRTKETSLHEGQTKSGTARYLTEINYEFVWHDVESGEEITIPWYGQGDDLAGPKGPGKAAAYAEKTFLLKQFHFPTDKDDPDNDNRTRDGELRQRGTQAARENVLFYRKAIPQMLTEICDGDAEKVSQSYVYLTKSEKRGYPGVDNIAGIHDTALAVVYGKLKPQYEKRVGHAFQLAEEKESAE